MEALAERLRLAELEIIAVKAMEVPNLSTLQILTGTINAKVQAIEKQMVTFGNFVKAEILRCETNRKAKERATIISRKK